MPEDMGEFVTGTIAVGAGIFLSTVGLGFVGGPLAGWGVQQIGQSLEGAPDPEGAQTNVARTDAAAPIAYGRQKIGLRVEEAW